VGYLSRIERGKKEKLMKKGGKQDGSKKVTCSNCGHKFYMEDYERKTCPKCGKVTVGPKTK
jgi:rubrerythrin